MSSRILVSIAFLFSPAVAHAQVTQAEGFKVAVRRQVVPTLAARLLVNAHHFHRLRFVADGQPRLIY